jgi:hypothetical protein
LVFLFQSDAIKILKLQPQAATAEELLRFDIYQKRTEIAKDFMSMEESD